MLYSISQNNNTYYILYCMFFILKKLLVNSDVQKHAITCVRATETSTIHRANQMTKM